MHWTITQPDTCMAHGTVKSQGMQALQKMGLGDARVWNFCRLCACSASSGVQKDEQPPPRITNRLIRWPTTTHGWIRKLGESIRVLRREVKIGQPKKERMKARFNGRCVECGEPIKVGREIVKNSKDKWVHKACSDIEEELPWSIQDELVVLNMEIMSASHLCSLYSFLPSFPPPLLLPACLFFCVQYKDG